MKIINLTNPQIVTCKELIQSRAVTVRIEIRNAECWIEDATHYERLDIVEKQKKAIKLWEKEQDHLAALLEKFTNKVEEYPSINEHYDYIAMSDPDDNIIGEF